MSGTQAAPVGITNPPIDDLLTAADSKYAVVIYALLSWFGGAAYSPVGLVLGRICEPLLAPFRRVIPPIGGLDLSALFLIIALQAVLILLR